MTNQVIDEEAAVASRRNFLKMGGLAAAGTTLVAGAGAGFVLGRDPDANVGWGRTEAGADQFFNRKPFEVDKAPTLIEVAPIERPEWSDFLFNRLPVLSNAIAGGWNPESGWEAIEDDRVRDYYSRYPERWPEMAQAFREMDTRREHREKYRDRFALAWAHGNAWETGRTLSNFPPNPKEGPEVDDFKFIKVAPTKFKSAAHASKLVKKMAYTFGASIVGITKLDHSFVFKNMMRKEGGNRDWGEEVPKHWKNIIVFGVPMNWDPMYAAAGYSTSYDGYFRCKNISGLLSVWLGELGYAARPQWPGGDYEVILPPIAVQAGMGESSRNGCLVTPEVGLNIRLAAVITDLDLEADKPINTHVREFCNECKICADTCPSGSISKSDEPDAVVRGWSVFDFNQDSCFRFWSTVPTDNGKGCRICVAVCPYTRKNNWIHTVVKELDPRDPTGITRKTLLAMQHNFFYYPDAEAFHPEWTGGNFAGYHEPPEWLRTENYLDVEKTWEYDGNWEGF
ncbi:4Fe-4S dicluster domain-containing protein [Endozoicomonas ascidiicola]|uniref:4Fe-4S dicluster domain-containing protein n=1 Tax=Endozoicomonas ascidiicola TaxID=1698521 RepID=UPI000AB03F80|nr:reductive dehalogenase domain-containing protein [Endozoicomonas ascidiicola]